MPEYKNLSKISGVASYEYADDFIVVRFRDGSVYTYSYESAGRTNVDQMKKLADNGLGLNSFINESVYLKYNVRYYKNAVNVPREHAFLEVEVADEMADERPETEPRRAVPFTVVQHAPPAKRAFARFGERVRSWFRQVGGRRR